MELKDIKGIGKKTLEILNKNNIFTIKNLIYCFPKSYEIYEENINLFNAGEKTLISATLISNPTFAKYKANVSITIFYVNYLNKKLKCVLFSTEYLRYKLHLGNKIFLYGKYKNINNEFLIDKVLFGDNISFCKPLYNISGINDSKITKIIQEIFNYNIIVKETLPIELIKKYKLIEISNYIYKAHFPNTKNDIIQVERRKKYEEFFWYLIRLEAIKDIRNSEIKEKRIIDDTLLQKFIDNIPFELTQDQNNAISVIKKDVLSNKVMNRLIQGDVSCGKSMVAYIFSLMLISSNFQVAIMVPSEYLALQQYNEAKIYFEKLGFIVELLTSKIKQKDKDDIIERINSGRVNLIIGTHSLLNNNIRFKKLGGVVIDEQHRFGVEQRKELITKYEGVDALYLTATPIPRSLGLGYFGDLDITSIRMLPQGRKKIVTKQLNYNQIDILFDCINKEISLKHQIYVVVPKVLEGSNNDGINIKKCYDLFIKKLPNARIGFTHGRLKNNDKNKVMEDFYNHQLDILISTTVIEVGINVKNATVMAIMDAYKFGLAELHQLRGRVGRGNFDSYCFLVSDIKSTRIDVIEKETDGFNISEQDFILRGPGDYIGSIQSGFDNLSYASFEKDFKIWKVAKVDAINYFIKFKNEEIDSKIFKDILKDKNVGNIS